MAGQQGGDQKPPEGDGAEQDTTEQQAAGQQSDVATAEAGDGGQAEQDGKAKGDGKATSFEDFLAGLEGEQQSLVRSELERRESDARKARNEAKNLRNRLNEAAPKAEEHDRALQAQKTAEERVAELNETLKSDNEGLRKRLVESRIQVLAADRFADPGDAAAFLNPPDYLTDELEPDDDAIRDALDDLLTRKKHLAKPDPKPRPPAPAKAQGSSGGGAPSVESQVAERRQAGDYAGAVALEMQKLGFK